jgi:hypothetical protein
MFRLFSIECTNADGEDCSAFVIAEDDTQAVELWKQADWVVNPPDEDAQTVFIIKPAQVSGPARVLMWHHDVSEC